METDRQDWYRVRTNKYDFYEIERTDGTYSASTQEVLNKWKNAVQRFIQ
jgi:hypothetical protein